MPVEHEFKHVLHDPEGHLYASLTRAVPRQEITQVYFADGAARVRRIVEPTGVFYTFTLKRWIGGRLLEIETDISENDFALACQDHHSSLIKHRFKVSADDAEWDIDFLFSDPNKPPYFVMAEAEMEEGKDDHAVLEVIAPYLVYSVPKDESEAFANAALQDETYARRRMDVLLRLARGTASSAA